jgi:exodeoxyribonuclease VII large subunit
MLEGNVPFFGFFVSLVETFSSNSTFVSMNERQPLTVTEITRRIKLALESGFSSCLVQGELSNVHLHSSGHLYFTLKDSGAQLSCVMWRSRVATLSLEPLDGMKVLVAGRITVYEVRGNYQLEAQSIRPLGIGDLQAAFERLKQKLTAEGLFDTERKRSLPEIPRRIAIITSPTGAVLHDMKHVFGRRFPAVELLLVPVRVQGEGAAEEISHAIEDANRFGDLDIIIIARGGGSLEDLWAFNEEIVARSIAGSHIPVVSAVGHETDVTIADFAADVRAPTPSAAAEIVVPDRRELLETVANSWYRISEAVLDTVSRQREHIRYLLSSYAFNRPIDLFRQHSQHLDENQRMLHRNMASYFSAREERARSLGLRLRALDPRLVLKRGFVIVRRDDAIIGSRGELHARDSVEMEFHDGRIRSTILPEGE